MTIIVDVFSRTDQFVNTFVTGGYAAAAAWAAPAIYAGFTLYVMVMGFHYLHSGKGSFTDMAFRLMKGAIIVTFATQWGWFSTIVYDGLSHLNDELGTALMAAFGTPAAGAAALENATMMLIDGIAGLLSRAIGFPPDFGALSEAISLFLGLFLLIGFSLFVLLFAKIAFAVTVVLAPVFIPFAFFEATRDMFGSWVRTVAGFVLIPILASVVIAFALSVLNDSLVQASTGNIHLGDAAIVGLLCTVFAFVMWQVPSIGAGMVGTVGVSGAGGMASMFMAPIARAMLGLPLISRMMRDRAAERWGSAVERGRQRQLERMRARRRQD